MTATEHEVTLSTQAVRDADTDRISALVDGDIARLESLLHADLVYVHSHGQVDSRESYLAAFGAGTWSYDEIVHDIDIETLVDGSVLAVGRMRARGNAYGREVEVESQTMSVWLSGRGGWTLRAFQSTRSPKPQDRT